jgi:hypothetical protein
MSRVFKYFMASRAAVAALLAIGLGGAACSPGPRTAAPVDATEAREALTAALDAWKAGKKPSDMKSGSPPMTVQDMDWESGQKLAAYELAGEGTMDNANLRIPVILSFGEGKGREAQKEVSYVVGTSPTITVFRELFQ